MRLSRRFKRIAFCCVYTLFLLLIVELGARAFWKARGVPFWTAPREIYRSFYPMISSAEREAHRYAENGEDCFEVLMLGGSALHPKYGDIEHVLRERLVRERDECVRIYNLAAAAHTSLDSYYKYRHLGGMHFDLVLVYHGINEVRANNCPTSVFQEDYSHLSWYKLINDYERRSQSRWFALPYTVKFVVLKVVDRLDWSGTLPTHEPDSESTEYGCDVKTKSAFRSNIAGLLELAVRRNEPVVLMSFAFYLPEDYTEERFGARELDYTVHTFPVELWGKPECVAAGVSAHNEVVAELARSAGNAIFVDQDKLIPKDARHFNDICHLTHEGCERFADNIISALSD